MESVLRIGTERKRGRGSKQKFLEPSRELLCTTSTAAHKRNQKPMRRPIRSKPQLLHAVLPSEQLRCENPRGCKHRHAPVVQLTIPHVSVVLAQTHGVAKVPWLLVGALRPQPQLQASGHDKKRDHAVTTWCHADCCKAGGHILETRKFHIVLN